MTTLADQFAVKIVECWLSYRFRTTGLPSAQVCIRKDGKILLSKAYGYANVERKRKMTTQSLCHVASHSKLFTACAIHLLRKAGLLRFDDPVVRHLPELKRHRDKRVLDITIRDLLSHRSGLMRDGAESGFWEFQRPFPDTKTLMKEIMQTSLVHEPNSMMAYSNFGYGLLGALIESVSGMSYADYVQKEILGKLPRARIFPDYHLAPSDGFADGYSRPIFSPQRKAVKHASANALAAATGFCANAESVSLFLHSYLAEATWLDKTERRELLATQWPISGRTYEKYGLGLSVYETEAGRLFGHSGGWQGFTSQSRYEAESGLAVTLILGANEEPFDLIKNIFGIFKKVRETFDVRELKRAVLSAPLFCLWSTAIYIVGDKHAIGFGLDTPRPADEADIYKKDRHCYINQKADGYFAPDQPVVFHRSAKGRIEKVDYSGTVLVEEKIFKKRAKSQFLEGK